MKSKLIIIATTCLVICAFLLSPVLADNAKPIQLPEPRISSGKLLMQALKERKTTRKFNNGRLSQQQLSNLLWAAFGVNRPDKGRRTAPSSFNRQEIDIYVVTADGAYLYDAKAHSLIPVLSEDIRALTGTQGYVKNAAVNLVYVSTPSKMKQKKVMDRLIITSANTGFIGQNVYLFCASEGMATVFRDAIDRKKLAEVLKLKEDQRINFAQSVGAPKSGK
ncbi:nitroreductase family protein [Thermodesulfobacteriota bacterium]